ncbi:MAG: HAD-IA family hydrolase [Dehalococcoidia bacterium]|nr:HAD-IA family hydrolase [Dehalococcoidia bacterium]
MELPGIAVPSGERTLEHCFGCGEDNPIGLKLRPVYDGEKVFARFTPGEHHQGWYNVTHGGIVYSILDEITAYAVLCTGLSFGVTAKSEIRFKHVAPTNATLLATAWTTKITSRLVETHGRLELEDGTVVAEVDSAFFPGKGEPRAFLWDMDGVIIDSAEFHYQSWHDTLATRGVDYTEEQFRSYFGQRNDHVVREILGTLPEAEVAAIANEKDVRYRELASGKASAFPGVMKLLKIMKKGHYPIALGTSAPMGDFTAISGGLGLSDFFDAIVCGPDVQESKPSPQIYLRAAEKLGVAPAHCIVFEDSPHGVAAAKNGGMKCVAITNTHPAESLRSADKVVSSLEQVDLIELIRFI